MRGERLSDFSASVCISHCQCARAYTGTLVTKRTMAANVEANCTVLIAFNKATQGQSPEDLRAQMESSDDKVKISAIKSLILMMVNGEKPGPGAMMHVIRFCINTRNKQLKKILYVFWEIVKKYDEDGKLLTEMILVCNAIRNDLIHANEYVRGSTLRFLCKLKEAELLEPLVPAIKDNLEHRVAYVRRNAVLCIHSLYKTFPDLVPDAPEEVEKFLNAESDLSARRNGFLMLFQADPSRAMNFLAEKEESIAKYGDGFQLVVLELIRKVCREDITQKGRFIMTVYNLLNSDSHAVAYEAAWTLVSLSSAATAVRAAAAAYSRLLSSSQSDNNIKMIVLDRLAILIKDHKKLVQENIMDVARALGSPNMDICSKTMDIILSLISSKNVDEVVLLLKKEIMKTQDAGVDKDGKYRQLLVHAIHQIAVRFPAVAQNVVPVLLEFLGSDGGLEVILFIREIMKEYPHLQASVLEQLGVSTMSVRNPSVMRAILWIFGEYSLTRELIESNWAIMMEALGPLPLKPKAKKVQDDVPPESIDDQPRTTVTVLADGTYATQTNLAALPENDLDAEDDRNPLRTMITEGNFFLGACFCASLSKMLSRAALVYPEGWCSADVKRLQVEGMLVMCSMVRLGQTLVAASKRIDLDSFERIAMWLRVLSDPISSSCMREAFIEDCGKVFDEMVKDRRLEKGGGKPDKEDDENQSKIVTQPDSLITFRQLRERRLFGAKEVDLDDEADISKATGVGDARFDFRERLKKVYQLTGFADPLYAEAYVTVHDYDIVVEVLVMNRTPQTLTNITIELATMGDLKIVERPQSFTLGPHDRKIVKTNIKVSSTETGHIFGNLVFDSSTRAENTVLNLHNIRVDIMDYIKPANCTEEKFRSMWAEFEWENKVAVNTSSSNLHEFLEHIMSVTNMNCLTPPKAIAGSCNFLAANLYARSIFGEDALVNVSVECVKTRTAKGEVVRTIGAIRIRSKTQGIALSLGDRITMEQKKGPAEDSK